MRPLSYVIRQQSPLVLARELLWRTRREWTRHRLKARLEKSVCPVRYEPAGYYAPDPSLCSERARRLILGIADLATEGILPLLSYDSRQVGLPLRWNLDFVSGKTWPESESDSIVTIRHDGSDVKAPWELSRLQVLPVLGKAFVLSGQAKYQAAASNLISDWIAKNPVGVGVNWTVAMEASLRAISICLYLDLMKGRVDADLLGAATRSLWEHLLFIEAHLEFSHIIRSNHYLSNLLGLYALSVFLRGEGMIERREKYRRLLQEEMFVQVYPDGGDKEASIGYQVLVAQMFTCGALLMKAVGDKLEEPFLARLHKMFRLLQGLADSRGCLPSVGDCDDGRVELLFDDMHQILEVPLPERNSLCVGAFLELGTILFGGQADSTGDQAAWYGRTVVLKPRPREVPASSRNNLLVWPESGVAVAQVGQARLSFLAMPNGLAGRGSHTHNDKLSFVLNLEGDEVFVDSGTGCYTRDRARRNSFRATRSHNTVEVDGLEQNTIPEEVNGSFCLGNEAGVSEILCQDAEEEIMLSASHSGYLRSGVGHHRSLRLRSGSLVVEDKITCKERHRISLYFQVAAIWQIMLDRAEKRIILSADGKRVQMLWPTLSPERMETGTVEVSSCYGVVRQGNRLRVDFVVAAPSTIHTKISWGMA